MSRRRVFRGSHRYDSALDLPQPQYRPEPEYDYNDYEGSFTGSAIPIMPSDSMGSHAPPWSQHNTRQDSDPVASHDALIYTTNANVDGIASNGKPMPAWGDPFISDTPYPHRLSPNTESSTSYSISRSPSQHQAWPNTFSAAAPSTLGTSVYIDDNTISCSQCDERFTGVYRSGNLRRHVQTRHNAITDKRYPCPADGCSKVYHRSDARLKHVRNKHHELCIEPPVHRGHSSTRHSQASDSSSSLLHVGQWLQDGQGSTYSHATTVKHLIDPTDVSQATRSVCEVLRSRLSPEAYALARDKFFSRWESVVQRLRDSQSEAYPVYLKALEDIETAIQAIETSSAPGGFRTTATKYGKRPAPPSGSSKSISTGGTKSRNDRVEKRSDRQQNSNGSRKITAVLLDELENEIVQILVDCPVWKHDRMHRIEPSCNGCNESVMAQVRAHLNPVRQASHRDFISFIQQCSRCKQDFVDRERYENHAQEVCDRRPQSRGDIVTPWVRLYLTLYPTATRVPSPFVNVYEWLDDADVNQCMGPFLGRGRRANNPPIQALGREVNIDSPVPLGLDAAVGHMLHDFVNPTFIQHEDGEGPILNSSRMSTEHLQQSLMNSPGNSSHQHWQNVLRSFNTHARTLHQSAPYLNDEQIRHMAGVAETIVHLIRELLLQQPQDVNPQEFPQDQLQDDQDIQLEPSALFQPGSSANEFSELPSLAEPTLDENFLPTTPMQGYNQFPPFPNTTPHEDNVGGGVLFLDSPSNLYPQAPSTVDATMYTSTVTGGVSPTMDGSQFDTFLTPSHVQQLNPSSSTQPSSRYRSGSSQYYGSSITSPSSTLPQPYPHHLSPEMPRFYERPLSLPPSSPPDAPGLQYAQPSRLSLQDNRDNSNSPYLAPSVDTNDDIQDFFMMSRSRPQ